MNRHWQTLIDTNHLLARSFYRDCHLTQRINSLAAQRNLTVERYHSHIRGWLVDFGNRGRETAERLDNILGDVHFPEVLFFSIPKLLPNLKELTYQNIATIGHSDIVRDARFSPDGKHLVTVTSGENSGGIHFNQTKFWELVENQSQEKVTTQHRQEKATIEHSDIVNDVHFSLDGKHLVIIPRDDGSVKICGLIDGKWQVKSTIRLFDSVANTSFSRDCKLLVIASRNGSVEICRLVNGKWQVKATIRHCKAVTNAHFGPDDYQIVTDCCDNTAKIWMLKNKESDDNSELVTSL